MNKSNTTAAKTDRAVGAAVLLLALVATACGGGQTTTDSSVASTVAQSVTTTDATPVTTGAAPTTTVADSTTTTTLAPATIEPLYPIVDGQPELPDGTVRNAYLWLIDEVDSPDTTTAEIQDRFAPSALAATSTQSWIDVIDEIRAQVGGQEIRLIDIVGATPISLSGLVKGESGVGWLNMSVELTEPGLITALSIFEHNGNLQYPEDQRRTFDSAVEAFDELGDRTSVLVARVEDGRCTVIAASNETESQPTGSIFKLWVLAAVGEAIAQGRVGLDDRVAFDPDLRVVAGSASADVPDGTEISVTEMARLMMGVSDNSATDILHNLVGRDAVEDAVLESNHAQPELVTPFLTVNEQFSLFWNVSNADAQIFVSDDEVAQQAFLESTLEPLGPATPGSRFNTSILIDGTWNASPMDICNVYAYMRSQEDTDGFDVIDAALGAQAAQTKVRNRWDRVWYKGGSLVAPGGATRVLTHSWFLESVDRGAYVVVGMANLDDGSVDPFVMQSILARLLELTAEE